jgi:hypothetical protein
VAGREYVPRATRYATPVPVFYRARGETTWAEGRAENISTSGVLVRGDRAVSTNAAVEMLLHLPSDLRTPFTGTTLCEGRIVRTISSQSPENRAIFAASILRFETAFFMDPRRI